MAPKINGETMFMVILTSAPNPDHAEIFPPAPSLYADVGNLEDASKACRNYIEEFNLGAGNWNGGDVLRNGIKIAYISYNGRIWIQD